MFLFLNSWRSTVITGLALPVSVLASFIAVWAFGFTLNTMSLLGLSLAIGILIDDAIVVRENIVRHVEMGKDHYTAAREGTSEIGLAVAATTFSIVVVFVPIAFMGGVAEQWFAPFALTIACSVLVSLFVSFSLDPMLSAYWPDPHVPTERRRWLAAHADAVQRLVRPPGRPLQARDRLGARPPASTMIALARCSSSAALALPALGFVGGAFFPVQDISEFTVVDRDAARIEPRVHAAEGRGGGAASRGRSPRWRTPTPPSAAAAASAAGRAPWTRRRSTCA